MNQEDVIRMARGAGGIEELQWKGLHLGVFAALVVAEERQSVADLVEQIIERMRVWQCLDDGSHALVAMAAGQFGDAQAVRFDQPGASVFRSLQKLLHARIAA